MRLIELEAAIKTACDAVEHYPSDWAVIETAMWALPVVEERKHGHWELTEDTISCPFCDYWNLRKKSKETAFMCSLKRLITARIVGQERS